MSTALHISLALITFAFLAGVYVGITVSTDNDRNSKP